jgi:hypothetical protein
MSIPERLWRVVKGHWALAEDRLAGAEAEAAAYEELAQALRRRQQEEGAAETASGAAPAPLPLASGSHDPLEASYALLHVHATCTLAELDVAYQERLSELADHPEGSPERAVAEARRRALEAAYERVRDAVNLTETRFEHLEF